MAEVQSDAPTKKVSKTKEADIVSRLTDPKLYTGSHKNRFDENGRGKGIDGRADRVELDGYVDGFKKKKDSTSKTTTSKKSPAIFDKLTDPKLYTGSHKSRFDENGKGLGVNVVVDKEKISDLSDITRPNLHVAPTKSPSKSSTTSTKSSTTSLRKSPSKKSNNGANIFDKLTDPSKYTGTHKNRFDDGGKGRGKAGRSDQVKADGYVNGYKHSGSYDT